MAKTKILSETNGIRQTISMPTKPIFEHNCEVVKDEILDDLSDFVLKSDKVIKS
jgi:hypothetical protein